MTFTPLGRRFLASCVLLVSTLAVSVAPATAAAAAAKPTGSLVKRPAPPKATTYAAPKVAKKVARSAGATPEREWTLMYYLDADCDLEAPMLDDLDEMEMIGATDSINILALVDRSPEHEARDGNWSNSRVYFITQDRDQKKLKSQLLSNLNEMDTANPQTLVEFVTFGVQNFPAKRYALVLGNHGGTWMGMLNDESDNVGGMKLKPFIQGLEALKAGGVPKLDLMVFDMCLMAQVEVMDAIAPYASFGVASEELEPGAGYPNHRVLHQLARNPKMSGREFAQSMVREWHASYMEVGEATVTSSATDLGKVGGVVSAVDALAGALMEGSPEVRAAAARARASTHFYGGEAHGGSLASYDLGEFASLLARQPEAASIKPQLDAVQAAIAAAVVEHAEGEAHKGSTGLAIYFPADGTVHPDYASVPLTRTKWDEFVKGGLAGGGSGSGGASPGGSSGGGSGGGAAPGGSSGGGAAVAGTSGDIAISAPDPSATHRLGAGMQVTATVSGRPISIRAAIGYRDDSGGITTISDEEVPSPDATTGDNGTIVSNWKDGETFTFELAPRVRAISDGRDARLAPTVPIAPGSPFVGALASYNSLMGDRRVATIFDTRSGELETIFCLDEGDASMPTAVHPVKGERLVFYQTAVGSEGADVQFRPVPPLVSNGGDSGLRLVSTGLPAGDYVLTLTAYDAAGAPGGRAELAISAAGENVAQFVEDPDYGMPAVAEDDVAHVDLTQIIPPNEYGHFEGTFDDYDFMAEAEEDDLSPADQAFVASIALSGEDLAFDVENWSDEFEDEELEHDGDIDNDGTPDDKDADDDGDGTPDAQDADDDGDDVDDEDETDSDADGTDDDDDQDDDNDGTPDDTDADDDGDDVVDDDEADSDHDGNDDDDDLDDDNDGTADDEDADDDGDGTADEQDADDEGDADHDGSDDDADLDDDNDGSPDAQDADDDGDGTADEQDADDEGDSDHDGNDDDADVDDDNDGTPDAQDADDDGDGTDDDAEADDEGDGTTDESDDAEGDDDVADDDEEAGDDGAMDEEDGGEGDEELDDAGDAGDDGAMDEEDGGDSGEESDDAGDEGGEDDGYGDDGADEGADEGDDEGGDEGADEGDGGDEEPEVRP